MIGVSDDGLMKVFNHEDDKVLDHNNLQDDIYAVASNGTNLIFYGGEDKALHMIIDLEMHKSSTPFNYSSPIQDLVFRDDQLLVFTDQPYL